MTDSQHAHAIGVFDSGVGGLTVARAIRQALPAESLLYLGDTARVPYGEKSATTVIQYALESAQFLVRQGVKALVVACNTSTAVALSTVAARMPVPVLGVIVPGACQALQQSRTKRIGVIATTGTVASDAYARALTLLDPTTIVCSHACPLFVPLAEEGWFDEPATTLVAERYLAPLRTARIDTLILGCTHYPLLSTCIQRVMGDDVVLVDSGSAVAADLRQLLVDRRQLCCGAARGTLRAFVTDASAQFARLAQHILDEGTLQLSTITL